MKPRKNRCLPAAVLCLLLPCLFSCYNVKKIVYFSNLKDTANGKFYVQDSLRHYQVRIEPGDILDIYVNSMSAAASAPFNQGGVQTTTMDAGAGAQGGQTGGGGVQQTAASGGGPRGYLVDQDGFIDFPVLGKIKVVGETTAVLRDTLDARLQQYLTQPSVNIRFLNYKITVLGEVTRPATYSITGERVSIMDALGMAGDLTIYGKRANVLVVREIDGRREFARLSLSSSDIFLSPYYFLKQNDIIYVEPTKPKIAASDDRLIRDISIASGLLAITLTAIYLFK
ncbi:MAG TPA: polysaccharide biosynthesis/export family protein [Dinghuibacter sp.]|jgi:polysaccharide export outer membrane protein|uniref:polysaccharide biosynthesis/export family protein n=1 Tax=Dinghuibacter sp. TaxID=2024697 RepID=UPI002CE7DC55|nr:polysaccharide biosynthesis/export family protein [Dinghuibacter sp.]HTJ12462.1 polysaccharide biosynthesis/export family protein [Dinghuibacter sp.]